MLGPDSCLLLLLAQLLSGSVLQLRWRSRWIVAWRPCLRKHLLASQWRFILFYFFLQARPVLKKNSLFAGTSSSFLIELKYLSFPHIAIHPLFQSFTTTFQGHKM
ncbi:hypothetical protein O6H91_11G002000 [Diphasiastrum complanatum]|uniref:Uncharacterized protein n=1 Tax=Diphasiastrum complanatum TaxID=34168 RepID=A0ACC2C5S7_DIPCM|nr:hypothetical protein O6H91_Y563100 [Diphasiastrum complanatum]KAJ7537335.1 hypothetical protein O6H91_11G002000 [Diphasiastrum complanatum]